MEKFVERKLRFLDGKAHSLPSLIDQEKENHSKDWRANLEKISINPMLIDKIRIPKIAGNTVATAETTVVCQKTLVDRIVIQSLVHNLSKGISFEDSSRRCSISTGRGRFSQTAERLQNSLATQALNDRMVRNGHCYESHLVCRLAEVLSSPAATAAQQLAAEESRRPRASQPSSSGNAIRMEAFSALIASREAISDFDRGFPSVN
jgi:hypothetical protein